MSRLFAAALACLATSCATGELPREARQFDRAWTAQVLGDEYARAGAYFYMTGEWGMVSVIHLPDDGWLVRRTQSTRDGVVTTVARSATCSALTESIDALQHISPTMREVGTDLAFFVMSDGADARLRVHTYFQGAAAASLTTIEATGNMDSPIYLWYEHLLSSAETCWTPEEPRH
ncbi:hypothetical protein [Terricaulis sp.]|uniref:hypothetical protein n=1 Tax=Terricaulis sp. TaxID=2768686 RepID=UPI003784AEF8